MILIIQCFVIMMMIMMIIYHMLIYYCFHWKEKFEAEIVAFVNSHDLHEKFIGKINNWIREHRSRAIDLFRKFDSDGDGTLSYIEFQDGMRDLNAPCSNIELHVLTRLLDKDSNGQLDYNEFSNGVRYFKPEETVPDDGLPILRICREELDTCQHCELKLWKPRDVKFPRYAKKSCILELVISM